MQLSRKSKVSVKPSKMLETIEAGKSIQAPKVADIRDRLNYSYLKADDYTIITVKDVRLIPKNVLVDE